MIQPQPPFQLITGKYLVDGKGGALLERGAVLLEGGKIRAVGPQSKVAAPEGAPVDVHDFPDGTILPGLIDVHTHLNYPGDGTHTDQWMKESDDILLMQSIANARQYLNLGVTTIRDNGSKNNTTLSLREGIRRGLAAGPRLILCGNPLTITGGHMWQMGGQADGVDGVIAAVRRVLKMGADYIKVAATGGTTLGTYPNLPAYNPDELRALIGEVHKFQKRVAAHVHATQAIIDLQEAGLSGRDMIIHCTWREPDGSSRYRQDVAARIAELGAWVNPTLHQAIGSKRERLREKGNTVGLTPAERARLDELERLYPERLEQIRQMADAGIKFVTGTDCGWGQVPFNEIHKEMDLLVQAGLSPMRAILSATRDAAESVGVGEVVGTLEPGKAADVAVFRGVPHRDVNDIANVLAVFQGGKRVR